MRVYNLRVKPWGDECFLYVDIVRIFRYRFTSATRCLIFISESHLINLFNMIVMFNWGSFRCYKMFRIYPFLTCLLGEFFTIQEVLIVFYSSMFIRSQPHKFIKTWLCIQMITFAKLIIHLLILKSQTKWNSIKWFLCTRTRTHTESNSA